MKSYNKIDRLKDFSNRFPTTEELIKNCTQEEADEYFLLLSELNVSFENIPDRKEASVDAFLRVNGEKIKGYSSFDDSSILSISRKNSFSFSTNLFYPRGYLIPDFPETTVFSSVSQCFQFHSSLLFLDRILGHEILNGNFENLEEIDQRIKGFESNVWNFWRVHIMMEIAKELYSNNVAFRRELNLTRNKLIVFRSAVPYWGIDEFQEKSNYWGKILTRVRIENQI